jgi:sugar O-acyltransferase (sialic acid O-acetyltransferase NeuD family)
MSSLDSGLVIFGVSNILSDLLDAALAREMFVRSIVMDLAPPEGERDLSLEQRLNAYARLAPMPEVIDLQAFVPRSGDLFLLGPTTPARAGLAQRLAVRFNLSFTNLLHPSAVVSPLATLGQGVFVGAGSVIAAGVRLHDHVFINRGVSVGHDTEVGPFSRIQPGAHLGGLTRLGRGVTVGLGAKVLERLRVGDGAVIGAGAVVHRDVAAEQSVIGVTDRGRRQQ